MLQWVFFSFSRIKLINLSVNLYFSLARLVSLRPRWNNAEIMSHQRWNDVVQRWKTVASMLCKVDFANVVQHWKSNFWFCFIFNIGWMLFQRRSTMLKQRWSDVKIGWVVSMKKLILRNFLPATLLTLKLLGVFKDYAETVTAPVLTNFFWWLLLRICLTVVVSNSSGLQQVPSCSI